MNTKIEEIISKIQNEINLKNGFLTEDDMYLHRAMARYITPEKTEKLKNVLKRIYKKNIKPEAPKYAALSTLTPKIRNLINIKHIGESNEN